MKCIKTKHIFIFLAAGIAASHLYINNTDRLITQYYKGISRL